MCNKTNCPLPPMFGSCVNVFMSVLNRRTHSSFRYIAVAWEGELPCRKWDCECAFKRQRGCCCGAPDLRLVEDQILNRMMGLWTELSRLSEGVLKVIGTLKQRHTLLSIILSKECLFWVFIQMSMLGRFGLETVFRQNIHV